MECNSTLGAFNSLSRTGMPIKDKKRFPTFKVVSFIILTVFCIVWISPFVILFTGAFRSAQDAMTYPGQIIVPPIAEKQEFKIQRPNL